MNRTFDGTETRPRRSRPHNEGNMSKADKFTRAKSYSAIWTQDDAKALLKSLPGFQRPFGRGKKFPEIVGWIVDNTRVPGVITIAVLNGARYMIDGQHRTQAFLESKLDLAYVEVRELTFDSLEEAAAEYRRLNTPITKMKPDDILRAEEVHNEVLQFIHRNAPFVGYENIRRGDNKTVLSMSVMIRTWNESEPSTPSSRQMPAQEIIKTLSLDSARHCVRFLALANQAWGRDNANKTLWGTLNMTLCMWLYRRIVLTKHSPRSVQVDDSLFKKCLMTVAADGDYANWLVGRRVCERDRSPCYKRLKELFAKRIQSETGHKPVLPQPEWAF